MSADRPDPASKIHQQHQHQKIDARLAPFIGVGIRLGLDRMKRLLAALDNPQDKMPLVHVAGTNGKGSVCAYLTSVLTEAGYRVGTYTSPHLVHWTERVQVGRSPISPDEFLTAIDAVITAAEAIAQELEDPAAGIPTLYEIVTAAAWWHFAQAGVDIAVMEVGLGGRLDGTNVCDRPAATAIVSIGMDHQQMLGDTLGKIAGEKAGIFKRDRPAIIGPLPEEARESAAAIAQKVQAPLTVVSPAVPVDRGGKPHAQSHGVTYPLALAGHFQLANSAVAIALLRSLQDQGWTISDDAVVSGMGKAQWAGRLQWTHWKNHPLLIDGAHNPPAAEALGQYVDESVRSGGTVTWIVGMLKDKDARKVLGLILRPGDRLFTVPVPSPRCTDPKDLAALGHTLCPELAQVQSYDQLPDALEVAFDDERDDGSDRPVILCGSLYLLGHFLELRDF
ncbi:MAG: folylpolyglutamate synthase/dihydrofolate synthase family protein [Cyanobacteria bacterium P01_H01_bin.130]